ncbi:hypothetical protein HWB90_gp038 [Mycobacterium phage Fowlmouth]|uniref:Uncharacterized protein n=1 Tax=Mycobacterium phage Fowlmouth TaxID=2419978 RepID=A0A3G2KG97_9CAUD|nr:hypothetical protein HWB90_gp038 [Mycobacterium phage Fowlmouth]AYN57988.1 hypothetical protein SEA_FOWLMOUTH_38 [Mycobacterium phage Fowlmouth]
MWQLRFNALRDRIPRSSSATEWRYPLQILCGTTFSIHPRCNFGCTFWVLDQERESTMASKVYVPMDKIVTCKRCGASPLAWVKSEKTGKFYLAKVVRQEALTYDPHKCHPDMVENMKRAKAIDEANGVQFSF